MKRFAIYFAPPEDSLLTRLAAAWLGRDPYSGFVPASVPRNGFSREVWRAATSDPRIYGFHATLKPPFRLASHKSETDLYESVRRFAESYGGFTAPPLKLASIASFLALTLAESCPEFEELAAACTREFDNFRAPPAQEETARRRRAKLTPTQLEYLERWGYPYVLDEWRFHMTLTSSLSADLCESLRQHLEELFAPYCREPFAVDAICVFEQPGPGEAFRVSARFDLA